MFIQTGCNSLSLVLRDHGLAEIISRKSVFDPKICNTEVVTSGYAKIRISNSSGLYLRAIAGSVISAQFRAISRSLRNSAQFRAI